jgi:hypothetical protein
LISDPHFVLIDPDLTSAEFFPNSLFNGAEIAIVKTAFFAVLSFRA